MSEKPMVVSLKRTCDACPSQWDGRLSDGRDFYARYRHGGFSVRLASVPGADPFDKVLGAVVIDRDIGNDDDGYMTDEQMQFLTRDIFEWVDA